MSYGKILGRLVITRRGKPRTEGTKSGECVPCHVQIKQGEVHFALLKTVMSKKKGKLFWTTRRFHIDCFTNWSSYIVDNFPEVEKKAKAKRYGNRPRPILSKLDPYELVERMAMVKRRGYLMRRLLANPQYEQKVREEVESEVKELALKIDTIAPSKRFATKKRVRITKAYKETTGSFPNV